MASADGTNTEPYLNLEPSEDIQLNVFLLDIAKDITDEDLNSLKFLLYGGSKKKVLSEIKTPLELFMHMRQRLLLTRDNLIVLQSFIWNLGNKKIFNKFIDFANKMGDTLHFTVPRNTPENGYKFLHFHIKGNLDSFTRPKLEAVRSRISHLLGVPEKFVLVAGLQPADSLILTIMVPEENYPSKLCITDQERELLALLGVDNVTDQDGNVIFEDKQAIKRSSGDLSQNDMEMQRLLRKVEDLERQLEEAQIKMLHQSRELHHLSEFETEENVISDPEIFLTLLTAALFIIYDLHRSRQDPKFDDSNLVNFRHILKKVKEKGYDEDIIYQLLDANTMVVRRDNNRRSMIQEFIIYSHQCVTRAQAMQIARLEYECEKLRYYMGVGEKDTVLSEREEFFLRSTFGPVLLQATLTQLGSNDLCSILCQLTKDLKKEEWDLLYGEAQLTAKEEKTLHGDKNKLLWILYTQKLNSGIPIEVSLGHILNKVKRNDLLKKFEELTIKLIQRKENPRNASKTGKRAQRKTKTQTNEVNGAVLKQLTERMTRIENKIDKISNPLGQLEFSKGFRNILSSEYLFTGQ